MVERPWRVFVSHTAELRAYPAGRSYIAEVERAVAATGNAVVDMAGFPAADQAPATLCADRVRSSDVYIGVFGTRYGAPVHDRPGVSYTEWEFETATAAGLPRLVFLLNTEVAVEGLPPAALPGGGQPAAGVRNLRRPERGRPGADSRPRPPRHARLPAQPRLRDPGGGYSAPPTRTP